MNTNSCADARKTYYVAGSGLFPVPAGRRNDIPKLREEHHASEVRLAFLTAMTRKLA